MDDKRRRWFHFRARLYASIRSCLQRHAVVIAMALWVPAVGWGVRAILQYSNTPGRPATPPTHWPHGTGIRFRHGQATLRGVAKSRDTARRSARATAGFGFVSLFFVSGS